MTPIARFAFNANPLIQHMDRVFSDLMGEPSRGAGLAGRGVPPINAWEDDHAVVIEAELPGFKIEQVDVTWEKQVLTIRGARDANASGDAQWLHRERATGQFSRAITITREIDPTGIAASITDGVLTITLPKAVASLPRKIQVSLKSM